MLAKLLVLFIVVPLVELFLLIWLTDLTNMWVTFGIIICTGFIGAILARFQGLRALATARRQVKQGELPASPLVDALLILVAGLLLLTPGLLTDLFGFSLLFPPTRAFFRNRLISALRKRFVFDAGGGESPESSSTIDSCVIEQRDEAEP